jgi:hypothetical protein
MDDRKTIPQRMDDLVNWTGIPALSQGKFRRRPFRWLSALAVLGAVGGFVASAAGGFLNAGFALGYMVLIASFVLGLVVQVFGPLKPFNSATERADEFDRVLRTRAYLFAYPVFAFVTALGLLLVMYLLVMQWPRPAVMNCLGELFLVLIALGFTLPTLYASWAVEWYKDDG